VKGTKSGLGRASLTLATAALLLAPRSAPASLPAGRTAPIFTLPRAGGGTLSLASLRGRPVYLNFFATWCPPCNDEAPDIARLALRYRARGLVVLGIDEQEDPRRAGDFIRKYHLPYPVLLDDAAIRDRYAVFALPVHVFIGRDGKIKASRDGEMSRAEIEAAIRATL
jgi:peroxiredoxin